MLLFAGASDIYSLKDYEQNPSEIIINECIIKLSLFITQKLFVEVNRTRHMRGINIRTSLNVKNWYELYLRALSFPLERLFI